jgi:hypothetical protein
MHAGFEHLMTALWQLEQRGGVKLPKKVNFRLKHNILLHLVMVSTLIFSTSFGTNKSMHNAIGSSSDSLPSIEPHLNLLKYNHIVIPPQNEFYELHVSKLKGVQRFFT